MPKLSYKELLKKATQIETMLKTNPIDVLGVTEADSEFKHIEQNWIEGYKNFESSNTEKNRRIVIIKEDVEHKIIQTHVPIPAVVIKLKSCVVSFLYSEFSSERTKLKNSCRMERLFKTLYDVSQLRQKYIIMVYLNIH